MMSLLPTLLLLAAAAICWFASGAAERLAERHVLVATLQATAPTEPATWQRHLERLIDPATPRRDIAADYWAGRYDVLPEDNLVSANAAFRKAQRESGGHPSVERLDQVMQAYAAVLKNSGFEHDAAFNYEYVARLRDTLAKTRTPATREKTTPAPGDDLPHGPTIHGLPGAHPPSSRGEEFEVLTPMDYREREAQPEPTPGRRLPRKG